MSAFYDQFPKDSNGFVDLSGIIDVEDKVFVCKSCIIDDEKYWYKGNFLSYFKSLGKNTLAGENYQYISELVVNEVVKEFGFGTIDYVLARTDKNYGVISKDFSYKYSGAELLEEVVKKSKHLRTTEGILYPHSLSYYKKCRDNRIISSKHFNDLQLALLLQVGLAQKDMHDANMAVFFGEKVEDDKIILFDHSLSLVSDQVPMVRSRKEQFNYLRRKMSELSYVDALFGVDFFEGRQMDIYDAVQNSPILSSQGISEYLCKMNDCLSGDKIFVDVNEKIEDVYHLPVPKDFMNRLKYVMQFSTKEMEKRFSLREASLDV